MLLNKKCCVQTFQPTQLIAKAVSLPCGAAVPVLLPHHVCTSDTLLCLQLRKWAEIDTWVLQLLVLGTGFFGLFFPMLFMLFYNFPCKQLPWPFA